MPGALEGIDPPGDELVVLKVLFVPLEFWGGIATREAAQGDLVHQVPPGQVEYHWDGLFNEVRSSRDLVDVFYLKAVRESSDLNIQQVDLNETNMKMNESVMIWRLNQLTLFTGISQM